MAARGSDSEAGAWRCYFAPCVCKVVGAGGHSLNRPHFLNSRSLSQSHHTRL